MGHEAEDLPTEALVGVLFTGSLAIGMMPVPSEDLAQALSAGGEMLVARRFGLLPGPTIVLLGVGLFVGSLVSAVRER